MFFVVYLVEPQTYAVIPCCWIYDENRQLWDKFVNKGLNNSQNYICYWASNNRSVSFLGAPNDIFDPNFAAPRSSTFPCAEATFTCRIIYFKGSIRFLLYFSQRSALIIFLFFLVNYMSACQRRDFKLNRNVPPAIYNQTLVTQRPIPIVSFAVAAEAMNNGKIIGAQQNLSDAIVELNDENPVAIEAFVVGEIHQEIPAVGEMLNQNIMVNINIVAVAANGIDEENFVADDSVATVDNELGVDSVLNEVATGDAINGETVATNEVDAINQEVPIVNEAISIGTVVKTEVVITRAALREINEILLHSEQHESSNSRK